MYILFGIRTWLVVGEPKGSFKCHECRSVVEYAECREEAWFHVFWIPLWFVSVESQGIRCFGCKTIHNKGVLGHTQIHNPGKWQCPDCRRIHPPTQAHCPMCLVRPDGSQVS